MRDELESDNSKITDLFVYLDLLEQTVKFFNNFYTSPNCNLSKLIIEIFKSKKLLLIDKDDVFKNTSVELEIVISGLLYIVMRSFSELDKVVLEVGLDQYSIIIDNPKRTFSSSFVNLINDETTCENIFNIFEKHIIDKANEIGYKVGIDKTDSGCLRLNLKKFMAE
jgi:hypothetical protein